jgi:hypothetical protein
MTDLQLRLIEALHREYRPIEFAEFRGHHLYITARTKFGGRTKIERHTAVLAFDDPDMLWGPHLDATHGRWGEAYGRCAFFLALLIGQGQEAALHYHSECRESGIASGAPQWWIDQQTTLIV